MATLVRWEPFRELATLQSEMSRLMNALYDGGGERTARAWVPALDAWETEDEVVYAFDLPGIPEDRISVELNDGMLTVGAERERTEQGNGGGMFRFERRFGSFSRTVALPQGADEESVTADYKDGVLEIHVRKPEIQKPRRIPIGQANGHKTIEGTATAHDES